jgi:hypothetical protein
VRERQAAALSDPQGSWKRCPICWSFLHHWFNSLAAATATLTCCRCSELCLLLTCDIWWRFDFFVCCWLQFAYGAAYDIKVWKNDQFRHSHQTRVGVPKDKRYDLLAQTKEAMQRLGIQPGPLCDALTAAFLAVTAAIPSPDQEGHGV